jgi:hypothetical protein
MGYLTGYGRYGSFVTDSSFWYGFGLLGNTWVEIQWVGRDIISNVTQIEVEGKAVGFEEWLSCGIPLMSSQGYRDGMGLVISEVDYMIINFIGYGTNKYNMSPGQSYHFRARFVINNGIDRTPWSLTSNDIRIPTNFSL